MKLSSSLKRKPKERKSKTAEKHGKLSERGDKMPDKIDEVEKIIENQVNEKVKKNTKPT